MSETHPQPAGDKDNQSIGVSVANLAAAITSPEAQLNPDPSDYRIAGGMLAKYFDYRVTAGFSEGLTDINFRGTLDTTVSAFSGLYSRDEATHRFTADSPFGTHPGDKYLKKALVAAWHAQNIAEINSTAQLIGSSSAVKTSSVIQKLQGKEATELPDAASSSLRILAVNTLREAVHSADNDPEVYHHLAKVGGAAGRGIVHLADVVGRHEKDKGNVGVWDPATAQLDIEKGETSQFKDYVAENISAALTLATRAA